MPDSVKKPDQNTVYMALNADSNHWCPELNPIEGLWDQVQNFTCNRRHENLDDMEQTLTTALRLFWESPARVLSLIHHWLRSQANATY